VEKIVVRGRRKLKGTINISGAKNAALPIIAASLLTKKEVILHNIPRVTDVQTITKLLHSANVNIDFKNNSMRIKAVKLKGETFSENLSPNKTRMANGLLGSLLSRLKRVSIPLSGGCKIGTRKTDIHVSALGKLGATINIRNGQIVAKSNELHGCHVALRYPSVGATENIIIVACLTEGTTTIENAAREPEIMDLANFLNSMGAEIRGAGTSIIKINGVDELSGTEYMIIPDRIETGTYAVAAAITDGDILLKNTNLSLLDSVLLKFREIGMEIEEANEGVRVTSSGVFYPVDIETGPYPGFPTDMQPIVTPLLLMADGESTIKETIFDNRFNHGPELRRMGANLKINGDTINIKGISKLKGAEVKALNIRAGASLIIAGLAAEGKTTISGVHHIFRGYENPLSKLKNVGANCNLITTR